MEQRNFEKLSTESQKKFRNDLWDVFDTYIEQNEEKKEEIPDFAFVETIYWDITKEKLSLREIFGKIQEHVLKEGYDNVHSFFQELSVLKMNSKYDTIFSEDDQDYSKTAEKEPEPTKEKLKMQITDFSRPGDHRDELVLLMMHHTSQQQTYNGYLVDANRFSMLPFNSEELLMEKEEREIAHAKRENKLLFTEMDRVIKEDKSGSNRIQIIVKSGPHYTTLDIDKENRSCFIVDAADDSRQYRLHQLADYSDFIDKVTYVKSPTIPSGKIDSPTMKAALQKDDCSCAIFASEHSSILAKEPDLHNWLGEKATQVGDKLFYVTWDQLSPEMVKNSQSTRVINHYIEQNLDQKGKILQLTNNNTSLHGFETTKQRFLQTVNQYCHSYKESELLEKLQQTSSTPKPKEESLLFNFVK
ncbi:hypothetical protein [Legionella sp.]|uniref:YopJ family acetyltransferase n=1 Tax=Legionella sp. TaxID=459 RepID=UPI00321FFBCF